MKAYTDIEQSKKLAEILPVESADGYWFKGFPPQPYMVYTKGTPNPGEHIHCWSLAALLSVLPYPSLHKTFSGWRCASYNKEGTSYIQGNPFDDPIDTCYEMILMLYELEML